MNAQSRGIVAGQSRWSLSRALVVGQVALSLVLVVSAALFVNTFRNLLRVDPGFNARGILLVDVDARRAAVAADGMAALQRAVLERVRTVPGVESAAGVEITPVGRSTWNDELVVEGYQPKTEEDAITWFNAVSDGYFTTMQTRLLAGRDFDRGDVPGSAPAAIVNDAWARHFFGYRSPLGMRFSVKNGDKVGPPYTIVGVVENAKYTSLRADVEPVVYLPGSQQPASSDPSIAIRIAGDPTAAIPGLTRAIAETHSGITLQFKTLSDQLAESLQRERMLASLSGLFGGVALGLAMLGLYGVMAYAVARRRGELSVRIALGAARARVVRMVLAEASSTVVLGVAIGVAGALTVTRLMKAFLFGLQPTDPGSFVLAAAILAAVALGAGFIPAWRASRVDPIEALRES